MDPVYFDSPGAFRSWLESHHASATELWVGYHKRATGTPSLTWPESVDEALCFGWIDGLRRRVDVGAPLDPGSAEGDDAVTASATAVAATDFVHRRRYLRAAAALR